MSTLLMDLVRQLKLTVAPLTKCVLLMLAFYVDDRNHRHQRRLLPKMPVAVDYEALAYDLGAGERTVRRALDELCELGLVSHSPRANDRRCKDYLIEVDTILALAPKPAQAAIAARLAANGIESSGQFGRDLQAKLATNSGSHLDLDLPDLSGSVSNVANAATTPDPRPLCDGRCNGSNYQHGLWCGNTRQRLAEWSEPERRQA